MRVFVLLLALAPALNAADLKITIVTRPVGPEMINGAPRRFLGNEEDRVTRHVYYSKGPLIREDYRGLVGDSPRNPDRSYMPRMVEITNCETQDWFAIDLDAREYREGKTHCPSEAWIRAAIEAARAGPAANRMRSNVRFESTTVDSGQTAEVFGHTAHHFVTTLKQTPTGGIATRSGINEEIIDAWYADLQLKLPGCLNWCMAKIGMAPDALSTGDTVDSRLLTNHTGPTPKGWAVKMTTTLRGWSTTPEEKRLVTVSTWEIDLTEVSEAPIDPALFRVPHGFKKVKHLYQH